MTSYHYTTQLEKAKMNANPVIELDGTRFSRQGEKLVSELSDLGIGVGRPFLFPVWKDACDLGIAIKGKTGRVIVFLLTKTDKDREGDIRCWEFVLCYNDDLNQPIRYVVIFND